MKNLLKTQNNTGFKRNDEKTLLILILTYAVQCELENDYFNSIKFEVKNPKGRFENEMDITFKGTNETKYLSIVNEKEELEDEIKTLEDLHFSSNFINKISFINAYKLIYETLNSEQQKEFENLKTGLLLNFNI